ncbi:MAG: GNAT family N-acetyltransferase [Candidatus Zixiibacteriota bacterium]
MIAIRSLQRADLEAYGELCRYCFDMPPEYVPFYTSWVSHHLAHTWGAFEQNRLCTGLWYYPYEMRVGEGFVPMGGVAAVATAPECRNSGMARMLMTHVHRQMRAEGRPLAALMPFKHGFYGSMGYADVFFMNDCIIPPEQIARRDVGTLRVRLVDGEREWRTLEDLHQAYGSRYFGTVRRNALYWRIRYLTIHREIKRVYLIERGRTPAGFVITNLGRDETTGKMRLTVAQAVWNGSDVLDAILQLLRSHRDQVHTVVWRLPTDVRLFDRMTDPRITVALKPKKMLKLVDFKGALEQRMYRRDLDALLSVELTSDVTSPWNGGRWRVEWRDGYARVRKARPTDRLPDTLRADIRTMAILYSGLQTAGELIADGAITVKGDAQTYLDSAFPRAIPYIDDWF